MLHKQNMATNKRSGGRLRLAIWSCSTSSFDFEDPKQSNNNMSLKLEPFKQSQINCLTLEPFLFQKVGAI